MSKTSLLKNLGKTAAAGVRNFSGQGQPFGYVTKDSIEVQVFDQNIKAERRLLSQGGGAPYDPKSKPDGTDGSLWMAWQKKAEEDKKNGKKEEPLPFSLDEVGNIVPSNSAKVRAETVVVKGGERGGKE